MFFLAKVGFNKNAKYLYALHNINLGGKQNENHLQTSYGGGFDRYLVAELLRSCFC